MDGKQLFAYGDMVTFTCNGKRLVGEVCIFDRNRMGDGVDSYDILVCADLYAGGGARPSGCLFKHIPEPDILERVGSFAPLQPRDPVCVFREADELYGSIAERDGDRAVVGLDDGTDIVVERPDSALAPLRTRWVDDDGARFHLAQYGGNLVWDEPEGCWTVEDQHGAAIEDVWPGSGHMGDGSELEVLSDGGWAHAVLGRRMCGWWLHGVGAIEPGDVVPVRSPYLAAVPHGHGGPMLWQRYYPGAQPNIPQDGGPGATRWTLT